MRRKKELIRYVVPLELTESELKDWASKKVKLWTDWLLPGGTLVGLVMLLILFSTASSEDLESSTKILYFLLLSMAPMIFGYVVSFQARDKTLKAKIAELKAMSIRKNEI
jgi:hypothetical protein